MPIERGDDKIRFWSKVDIRSTEECWPWKAKAKTAGYGCIQVGGRKGVRHLSHRYAWILENGEIPKGPGWHGWIVMHTCDNRLCCNPSHLKLATQADNVRDMDRKGRRVNTPQKGSTHHYSKLTESLVVEIRLSVESNSWWAKKLGMTRQAIRYARMKGWKHI